MRSDRNRRIRKRLVDRSRDHLLRSLVPVEYGRDKNSLEIGDNGTLLNFCSNDYLGLSTHPELIRRSVAYTEQYGTSASASRLVSGSLEICHALEEKIARLYGSEACLLFGSGFLANATLLPALAGRGDLILADKKVHNSIIHGGSASLAEFRRFRHNDCDHLEELLKKNRSTGEGSCWIVTETLFSMDGVKAPLEDIVTLCERYDACLMVDDAHAFGVWGREGLGYAADLRGVDLAIGTFGKAGGGYGAFVTCTNEMKSYLVNFCDGVIYSTAPTPGVLGAADAAMDLIPAMGRERRVLAGHIDYLTDRLVTAGYDPGKSRSQIIPLMLEDEKQALALTSYLRKEKIFVQAIRPPTVSRSRIRLTLNALHTRRELDRLLEVLNNA